MQITEATWTCSDCCRVAHAIRLARSLQHVDFIFFPFFFPFFFSFFFFSLAHSSLVQSLLVQNVCRVLQNGHSDHSYADNSMPPLHVDLYTGPQCRRADLEICRRPDGSPWLLGEGACGKVYKVGDCVPAHLSALIPVCPSICLSICPSIHLNCRVDATVCLSRVQLLCHVHLFVHPSVRLSVCCVRLAYHVKAFEEELALCLG